MHANDQVQSSFRNNSMLVKVVHQLCQHHFVTRIIQMLTLDGASSSLDLYAFLIGDGPNKLLNSYTRYSSL